MTNPTPHGQVPEALETPSPDQLRAIARVARNSSGSASDDCGPLAYVLHGWRAAVTAMRAAHVQNPAEIEHVAGDVSKTWPESNMAQQPAPSAAAQIDSALNDYAQAFVARVNGWTKQNGDDLPVARAALFQAITDYARELAMAAPQPSPTPQAADSVLEDAARLDWLALAGPVSICVVIDRPNDGEVEVATDDVTGYGETLREALDAARKQGSE